MTSQAIVSYFSILILFSNFTQYMSMIHGHSTIGGIGYGGCGEDKKKEIVSHQLGVSTGYGDAQEGQGNPIESPTPGVIGLTI